MTIGVKRICHDKFIKFMRRWWSHMYVVYVIVVAYTRHKLCVNNHCEGIQITVTTICINEAGARLETHALYSITPKNQFKCRSRVIICAFIVPQLYVECPETTCSFALIYAQIYAHT